MRERKDEHRRFKPYRELTFTDDFMFSKVLNNNPEICQELIELILGIKVSSLEIVTPQYSIKASDESRGVRFDVYAENSDKVFDVEMQTGLYANLPKRSRYYNSIIDVEHLGKGCEYEDLPDSYVIFICMYDPFGEGLCKYTFTDICREKPDIELGTRSFKVFINAKSKEAEMTDDMKALIDYLNGGRPDSELAKKIEQGVISAKDFPSWSIEYMQLKERYERAFTEGKEEGVAEIILAAYSNGKPIEEIASFTELPVEKITEIVAGQ